MVFGSKTNIFGLFLTSGQVQDSEYSAACLPEFGWSNYTNKVLQSKDELINFRSFIFGIFERVKASESLSLFLLAWAHHRDSRESGLLNIWSFCFFSFSAKDWLCALFSPIHVCISDHMKTLCWLPFILSQDQYCPNPKTLEIGGHVLNKSLIFWIKGTIKETVLNQRWKCVHTVFDLTIQQNKGNKMWNAVIWGSSLKQQQFVSKW